MLEGIKGVSSYAGQVDNAFIIVTAITLFLFIITIGSMLYFVYKYKASKNSPEETKNIKHYTPIEIAWTVIPTILMMIVFYFGLESLRVQRTMPNDIDSTVVKVLAQRWSWQFEYPNGKKSTELTIPVNTKVKLKMRAPEDDVIHSFYVPAFRAKEDILPGKETKIWFSATELGKYDIQCAEYCGTRHSFMRSFVNVVSKADFEKFLNPPKVKIKTIKDPIETLTNNGCTACHSLDGTKLVGPTFKDSYGKEIIVLENGVEKTIIKDEEYFKNSILKPKSQIVKDFPPIMPSFEGRISNKDIQIIINYLKDGKIEQETKPKIDAFELIQNNGCTGCHSLDGSKIIGPSFKGIYQRETTILKDGKEFNIKVDEEYIKNSILNPKDEIVKEYPNIMPPFKGILTEDEVKAISKYLRGIK